MRTVLAPYRVLPAPVPNVSLILWRLGLPEGHPDRISIRTAMEMVGLEDIEATLDTVRDDGGAAGGSSFRGLLPAGATAPLAEDDKR